MRGAFNCRDAAASCATCSQRCSKILLVTRAASELRVAARLAAPRRGDGLVAVGRLAEGTRSKRHHENECPSCPQPPRRKRVQSPCARRAVVSSRRWPSASALRPSLSSRPREGAKTEGQEGRSEYHTCSCRPCILVPGTVYLPNVVPCTAVGQRSRPDWSSWRFRKVQ